MSRAVRLRPMPIAAPSHPSDRVSKQTMGGYRRFFPPTPLTPESVSRTVTFRNHSRVTDLGSYTPIAAQLSLQGAARRFRHIQGGSSLGDRRGRSFDSQPRLAPCGPRSQARFPGQPSGFPGAIGIRAERKPKPSPSTSRRLSIPQPPKWIVSRGPWSSMLSSPKTEPCGE